MQLLSNLRMALKALWSNRLRATLTMLGIIVGVGSVVTLIAYSAGVEHDLLSSFDRRGATLLTMGIASWLDDVPQSLRVDREDAQAVREECWTVERVALAGYMDNATVEYSDREYDDCDIYCAEPPLFEARPAEFAEGRAFNAEDDAGRRMVCVLGAVVHRELFFQESAVGKTIIYSGRPLTVVGVLAEQGGRRWDSTDYHVVIPYGTAEAFFSSGFYGGDLVMKVRQFELMPYAETQVRELLLERHPRLALVVEEPPEERRGRRSWGMNMSSAVWSWSMHDRREQRQQVAQSLTRFLIVMGALALLIGCVGVMNIMLVTVEERTAEIGLRKALGASSAGVLSQFLAEAVLICCVGGFAGSLAAWLVCRYLQRLPDELNVPDPIFTSAALAVAITVTLGSGIAAGMYPAMNAASLDPIEALRHE
jgi:hypothetical protein